jgi:hypothetical protein
LRLEENEEREREQDSVTLETAEFDLCLCRKGQRHADCPIHGEARKDPKKPSYTHPVGTVDNPWKPEKESKIQ